MNRSERAGATLVAVSMLLYTTILAVPWLVESTGGRVKTSVGLGVAGEAAFWLGALIAGPAVVRRYRGLLSPTKWFRRRAAVPDTGQGPDQGSTETPR